jgi:hypothetical protein
MELNDGCDFWGNDHPTRFLPGESAAYKKTGPVCYYYSKYETNALFSRLLSK